MIPPDAQRAMSKRAGATVIEVQGSHAVYVSQPQAVASITDTVREGCCLSDEVDAWGYPSTATYSSPAPAWNLNRE